MEQGPSVPGAVPIQSKRKKFAAPQSSQYKGKAATEGRAPTHPPTGMQGDNTGLAGSPDRGLSTPALCLPPGEGESEGKFAGR